MEVLVGQLRAENEEAARIGEAEVARMGSEREHWELQQREGVMREFCLEAVLGNVERLTALYQASGEKVRDSMRATLKAHKLAIPVVP